MRQLVERIEGSVVAESVGGDQPVPAILKGTRLPVDDGHMFRADRLAARPTFGCVAVDPVSGIFRFTVPAESDRRIELLIRSPGEEKANARVYPLEFDGAEKQSVRAPARPGDCYCFRIYDRATGGLLLTAPDPMAYTQEDGHWVDWQSRQDCSWSVVDDPAGYHWPQSEYSYEPPDDSDAQGIQIDFSTASPEGTFAGATKHIDDLTLLGPDGERAFYEVLPLPVDEFYGPKAEHFGRGYEPSQQGSVQSRLGGPEGYREFISACHSRGIKVGNDAVLNHWGPEDGYVHVFHSGLACAAYETKHWGWGPDWDNPTIVQFMSEIIIRRLRDDHVDTVRLDAAVWIGFKSELADPQDPTRVNPEHPLVQLVGRVREAIGRPFSLVLEHPGDDALLVKSVEDGGLEVKVFNDSLRHALVRQMTGTEKGFYGALFPEKPGAAELIFGLNNGFLFGEGYPGKMPGAPDPLTSIGSDGSQVSRGQLVHWGVGHDWIMNAYRMAKFGEVYGWDASRTLYLFTNFRPGIPFHFAHDLFNKDGQPFGWVAYRPAEKAPALREGFIREHGSLLKGDGDWQVPDPCDRESDRKMRLDWKAERSPRERAELKLVRDSLLLRKATASLRCMDPDATEVDMLTTRIERPAKAEGNGHLVAGGNGARPAEKPEIREALLMRRNDSKAGRVEDSPPVLTVMNIAGEHTLHIPADHHLLKLPRGYTWQAVLSSRDEKYAEIAADGIAPIEVTVTENGIDLKFQATGLVALMPCRKK